MLWGKVKEMKWNGVGGAEEKCSVRKLRC